LPLGVPSTDRPKARQGSSCEFLHLRVNLHRLSRIGATKSPGNHARARERLHLCAGSRCEQQHPDFLFTKSTLVQYPLLQPCFMRATSQRRGSVGHGMVGQDPSPVSSRRSRSREWPRWQRAVQPCSQGDRLALRPGGAHRLHRSNLGPKRRPCSQLPRSNYYAGDDRVELRLVLQRSVRESTDRVPPRTPSPAGPGIVLTTTTTSPLVPGRLAPYAFRLHLVPPDSAKILPGCPCFPPNRTLATSTRSRACAAWRAVTAAPGARPPLVW